MNNKKLGMICMLLLVSSIVKSQKPNIIVILSDDHAYQTISAYKDRFAKIAPTPNIDKLANEGIRFDRSYVGNSLCAPSRATLLTGTHSHINGIETLKETFDGHQPTIANILQRAGYETSIIGKWHLKSNPVGFSHWDILIDQGDYYNSDFKSPEGIKRDNGYVTDIITDKAIDWLKRGRNQSKPFLMIVGNKAPHANWIPPVKYLNTFDHVKIPQPKNLFDKFVGKATGEKQTDMTYTDMPLGWYCQLWSKPTGDRYEDYGGVLWQRAYGRLNPEEKAAMDNAYDKENDAFRKANPQGDELVSWKYQRTMRNYLACVKSVDDNVGRLMDYLKSSGLDKNTLVIYTSDQGLFLGEHGWYDKRFMYEEAFRTPLIAYFPSVIPTGQVDKHLVQNIDWAPTILDFAGVEAPKEMQGVSLKPLMTEKQIDNWRESLYYHYYDYPGGHNIPKHDGVITNRYKLIHFYEIGEWEFFDLKKDPSEMKNDYNNSHYQSEIVQLKEELVRLRKTYQIP